MVSDQEDMIRVHDDLGWHDAVHRHINRPHTEDTYRKVEPEIFLLLHSYRLFTCTLYYEPS